MEWRSLALWTVLFVIVYLSGLIYGWQFYDGSLIGGVYSSFICIPLILFERGLVFRRLRIMVAALPTWAYIACGLVIYFFVIPVGFFLASVLLWSLGLMEGDLMRALHPSFSALTFTAVVASIIIAVLRVRDLLGQQVFLNLLLSRYRKPITEERIFLFLDLVDSTAYAERHGDLRMMEYLSALFAMMAGPVRRHKGAIDDYVGDAVIVTWPMTVGIRDALCIRCLGEILTSIEKERPYWEKSFGKVPKLRAALHGGPVITAEVGVDHHKITYFGDTVNMTARIEALCRSLNVQVLVSASLARRIDFPHDVRQTNMGSHVVHGRDGTIEVVALSPADEPILPQRGREPISVVAAAP